MSAEQLEDRIPFFCEEVYTRILDETQEVADKALDRLRMLGNQLPAGMIEQVERLRKDPAHERRKTVRVNDLSIPVAVQIANLAEATDRTALKDHCPTGLAVLLPCPAAVGTILRVRMPAHLGGGGWVTVEVKYCRRAGEEWIAGCELLDEQPPI
ncbi:MAG TPA: hypothetical protein VEL76_17465 [Gemmataceae bacterium]|nr:hypothetical protein [Gemmataceae bacterium]